MLDVAVDLVDAKLEMAKARGAKRAVLLPVSVPSHSSLMRDAAQRFGTKLEAIELGACP